MRLTTGILATAFVAAFAVAAIAQQPIRIAGKVTGMDEGVVAVKDAKGEESKINVPARCTSSSRSSAQLVTDGMRISSRARSTISLVLSG